MDAKSLFELASAVLASLGGGIVIVYAFSNYIGKLWANRLMDNERAEHAKNLERLRNDLSREMESYKIQLKKSEIIFEKQLLAASELMTIVRSNVPAHHEDAVIYEIRIKKMIRDFDNIGKQLKGYLSNHGSILPSKIIDLISDSINIISSFHAIIPETENAELAATAQIITNNLKDAEAIILGDIRSQQITKDNMHHSDI